MDIQMAISWLQRHEGLVLPHGIMPGTFPGGFDPEFDAVGWLTYRWNPPPDLADLGFDTRDSNASPKPTWAKLLEANASARQVQTRDDLRALVDREEARRIRAAYGVESFEQEVLYRLRAASRADTTALDAQDAERDRLRSRGNALRVSIRATMTQAALDALDPRDDAFWRESTTGGGSAA